MHLFGGVHVVVNTVDQIIRHGAAVHRSGGVATGNVVDNVGEAAIIIIIIIINIIINIYLVLAFALTVASIMMMIIVIIIIIIINIIGIYS